MGGLILQTQNCRVIVTFMQWLVFGELRFMQWLVFGEQIVGYASEYFQFSHGYL